jgi:type IV pilus assembly protein PilX
VAQLNPPRIMAHRTPHHGPDRGVSLLFALLALVALSVAAVGLVRTVGTGSLVVGNVGFKKDATAVGDRGAEAAIAWLQANNSGTTLDADITASGYYATSKDSLDPTGRNTALSPRAVVDWNNDDCATVGGAYTACLEATPPTTVGNNSVNWIITRLCAATGSKDDVANSCATSLASGMVDDSNSGGLDYSAPGGLGATTTTPYYRIVVRTLGARNTVSYTETIVHF